MLHTYSIRVLIVSYLLLFLNINYQSLYFVINSLNLTRGHIRCVIVDATEFGDDVTW